MIESSKSSSLAPDSCAVETIDDGFDVFCVLSSKAVAEEVFTLNV